MCVFGGGGWVCVYVLEQVLLFEILGASSSMIVDVIMFGYLTHGQSTFTINYSHVSKIFKEQT